MGIRGLLTAIVERKEECSETVDLVQVAQERGGIELLVDFYSFEHLLVRSLWQSLAALKKNEYLRILGAEYETIHTFVDKLVRDLKGLGISLVFYIDGSKGASSLETRHKIDTWKFRFRSECMTKRDILRVCAGQGHISELSYDTVIRSVCLEMQLVQTLRGAGCEVLQSPMGEADVMLARDLKDRNKAFAVLSNDSDFCVFRDCCFIPNILFDLGSDLGLGQPLMFSHKPQRLMCGVVSSARVRNMLQFPEEVMVIELSIIAGNDFTAPYLKKQGVTMASKLGIENHRNLFNFASWVRKYGRVENCPQFKEEMDKCADLRNAVEYSRQFYLLQNIPDDAQDKGGYIQNLIIQRIRAGVYPPHFLPMYRGFYWHRSILEDVGLCLPAEEVLAPLRAMIYSMLLPRHRTGVMEWGQALDRDLTRNLNRAVEDCNLPTLNQIKENQIFKNLRVFHYVMSHLEYSIADKTWFDRYGRKTGFICYVLRYFLLLNWGQGLQLMQEEFLALAAVALGSENNSNWQDLRICPDPRCVIIAGLFQDVYRHAYLFLGSLLHLTHEFPLPKDIFSGSKWTVYYALSGGPHSFSRMFPVSSSDQLCYVPADSVFKAQMERDAVLHDRRHMMRFLVDGVFPFDERRF